VLVNVAFITLLERKILGYSQLRLGPNKPSFAGLLQPIADAVKLFSNKAIIPYLQVNLFLYMPFLSLGLILII
jgi:NADH:ubiquinone oxidoreductase subunit H